MLADKIVGRVGADILRRRIGVVSASDGAAALFRLDRLNASQIASVVREVLADPNLREQIEIKIPEVLVAGLGLPPEVLTDDNAGAVRNIGTDKAALLTANGNEPNISDTLGYVTALGAQEFRAHEDAWAEATVRTTALPLAPEDRRVFQAALKGLLAVADMSLFQLGDYCAQISEASRIEGHPIRDALGWALPRLVLPRDTTLFSNTKSFGTASGPWRKAFEKLFSDRAPLLLKQRKTGQAIDPEDMRERFTANLELIQLAAHPVIEAFIQAQPGDPDTKEALSLLEWESDGIHLLFDRPKEKQQKLADHTLDFFENECTDPGVLTDSWKKHLEELKVREKRSDWNEADEEFFELHRRYLGEDTKLRCRWEKVVFGKPIEYTDFLDGFVTAVQRLAARAGESTTERFISVRVAKGRTEWRERFNHDIGAFFSVMYRGLPQLLGERVRWHVEKMGTSDIPDPLFDYPAFFEYENKRKGGKLKPSTSASKLQTQIKFEVSLVEQHAGNDQTVEKTQLLWMARPEAIGLTLHDDMKRLLEKGGIACTEVPRRMVSKKGGVQSVSLLDVNTLEATFGRDAGSLVPPPGRIKSLRAEIKRRIDELYNDGRLTAEQQKEIKAAWVTFESDYSDAIKHFLESGLHTEAILNQAESFGALLRVLKIHARGDIARAKLVSEVLTVGTVRLTGDQPSIIVPPWHPERMKALAVKLRRVAGLITHLLAGQHATFGDRNIFFQEFSEELEHPFYPEIAVADRSGTLVLVTESSTVNGYSLLERPVRADDEQLTDVSPVEAARQIRELLERYVGLQPHERSNLSVLLYNADAADLPLATVRELANLQDDLELHCNVSVRHQDAGKLRRIYAELVSKSDADPDVSVVSETSDNFMSKLRISVSPPNITITKPEDGFRPFDIAFLHDVVSRTATEEWIAVDWLNDRPVFEHAPSRWSYRSVSGENELKSTTFLTCPQQTASGRAYVDMVGAVVRQQDVPLQHHLVPARQISLQSDRLRSVFEDAHNLAEWVATYDELLDKRQLQANKITVVRYRRNRTNGRNMIVSSTSELRLLSVLAKRRIYELGLTLTEDELNATTQRLIDDAVSISGDIVLRAAKRGVSAGELIGLVLSRFMMEQEFQRICGGADKPSLQVFFLLDDYASWLAQRESRIADLLGLCIQDTTDGIRLHLSIVESKYVAVVGEADARRSSKAQLLATLTMVREALFGDPGRLDRDLWLSRIADLLIDAVYHPLQTALLERARAAIRDGSVGVTLRGYSHIFVHTSEPGQVASRSERITIEETDGVSSYQEVFSRPELRRLTEAYARREDSLAVRQAIGVDTPWDKVHVQQPAKRVTWTDMIDRLTPLGSGLSNEISSDASIVISAVGPQATSQAEAAHPPEMPIVVPSITTTLEVKSVRPKLTQGTALMSLVTEHLAQRGQLVDDREAWAKEVTANLKKALNSYGLQANVIGTRLTPNGCLIRLSGSDRLRVEDIEAKRTQLLTTHSIQLVTVQPKPGEIIVSVAGEMRQPVSLWDVWAMRQTNPNAVGINTSFVLGLQELNGNVLYLNLGGEFGGLSQHEPHSLIAGSTGSGKSVLIQALLLDIAATNPSSLANIILIDPKMGVDYAALDTLPHLREAIITTRERAVQVLNGLVEEMEERYRIFAVSRARDLSTYNAKSLPEDRMPMVFLVHDEFADWMLDDGYKGTVSAVVQRLGVKARAAGIHLFFAAQRPDKDVMPMQLRENLGNRLILKVSSEATSRIALDRPGAEMLLGKGHLAAKLNGEQGLIFAQAPYLSDDDIVSAVEAIRVDNEG
ncbi:FtsK/SpoIIIE domain-containing protein [Ferrovum myxofaciens]|uniref:FtsK/SpoIIIE domain-containing protein n=1 Tax=Ferrovum myxofaciens TaxID=416213 RepID=UPI003EB92813